MHKCSDIKWIASLHLVLLLGEATTHSHTSVELLSLRITHATHSSAHTSTTHWVKWICTTTSHGHLLISHKWILPSHHLLWWHLLLLHEWIHTASHTATHCHLILLLHHSCLELILHGLSHHLLLLILLHSLEWVHIGHKSAYIKTIRLLQMCKTKTNWTYVGFFYSYCGY